MTDLVIEPDYIFEVSWEICNKVGGINTVIATKAPKLMQKYGNKLILIGPDVWRDTDENPAFEEDKELFKDWKYVTAKTGLRVRTGRWNIVGKPMVILIDFTSFISKKNEILEELWKTYKLDSIYGQYDYVEAAMFGYAAGKVIESFFNYNLAFDTKCIAHFHEWMTGTGILYLHTKAPHISTMFTTHATVLGRSLAGNNYPLYKELTSYHGDTKARELGVIAKHSLEKLSAQTADCFTTVSEITATECAQFLERKVDVITPNGFDDSFVPKEKQFEKKRKEGRTRLLEVAEAIIGEKPQDDAIIIANSGRYEFKNKGIDLFIEAMSDLNKSDLLEKQIIAFIMVPTSNYGPRKDLVNRMEHDGTTTSEGGFTTHYLHHAEYDQILNAILAGGITNSASDKVKIIYAPSYLDGNDGIFNMKYYDMLIGMDLTIFPSYYEPWGYTPLESLAFSVPTITTNHAGIGMWVNRELVSSNRGIEVLERNVGHDTDLIRAIVEHVIAFINFPPLDRQMIKKEAFAISRIALWEHLIKNYFKAYNVALQKRSKRSDIFVPVLAETGKAEKIYKSNRPDWKQIVVETKLPERFKGLNVLARNIWWSWNYDAVELFRSIDAELWGDAERNPIIFLKQIPYARFKELENDIDFMGEYDKVMAHFHKYMNTPKPENKPAIAYFSMEYGLHDTLKIYSGGLGILAGDYLKEASDANFNLNGIGLLYRYGYFTQQITPSGEQFVQMDMQNFDNLPIERVLEADGTPKIIQVPFPGRVVYVQIWKVAVGRINLYLLDTDFDKNNAEDRTITYQLYGGDSDTRIKQELILGIGGIKALTSLELKHCIYHCNEGHAAFITIERLNKFINEQNLTFNESVEIVRASNLFTTHTPVPAGHDAFSEDQMMMYLGHYSDRLNISWDEFMNLGKMRPGSKSENFSMSHLAANLSQEINGVSMLHGEVTKMMFNKMWDGYQPEELHIGYVTNGVHYNTWTAKDWRILYEETFGKDFEQNKGNKAYWQKIKELPDQKVWDVKNLRRKKLMEYIKQRLNDNLINRHVNPKKIVKVTSALNHNTLTIGFARRFATYKRAHLLFSDMDRLNRIVNNPERPVQFVFAGKAHPSDGGGQKLIKHIIEISQRPEFMGKIIFLQNYDIELAKKLVKGVDVWLNTPTRPLEASGTSGMKAVMNGVLNLSVLDGWWVEGYKPNAGWALAQERTYENQDFQDELDAEVLYNIIESEIAPMFYERNENNIPVQWVQYIKNCIADIAPDFTTTRMINDYNERFYTPMYARVKPFFQENYRSVKELAAWKRRVVNYWKEIQVTDQKSELNELSQVLPGEKYILEYKIELGMLKDVQFGIEMQIVEIDAAGAIEIIETIEGSQLKLEGSEATYQIAFVPTEAGNFKFGVRLWPHHPLLPHRQDFPYLKWL